MSEAFYPIQGTIAVALTFDQEIAYARNWKKKKDQDSRDILIRNYVLFSVKQVKRMYPGLAEDDAIRVAHEAVLDAIDKFDPNRAKQGRLSNLIPYYVKISFRNFRRRSETVKCPIKEPVPEGGRYSSLSSHEGQNSLHRSNEETGFPEEHTDNSLIDSLFGAADSAAENFDLEERKQMITDALNELPESLKDVLSLVYFENLNFAEVARRHVPPISREAVRQKHNRAIAILREALNSKVLFGR